MRTLHEGLEKGDLKRLVKSQLSVDEFKSKMGDDADICVLAFTVYGKDPATDLMNFVEKSYDFVLDADCSSGEDFEGDYMVFVEMERNSQSPNQIFTMMEDVMNLTDQDISEWKFTYYKDSKAQELSLENLQKEIVTSPQEYATRYPAEEDISESAQLNAYRALANVPVTSKVKQTPYISHIQSLAGIK